MGVVTSRKESTRVNCHTFPWCRISFWWWSMEAKATNVSCIFVHSDDQTHSNSSSVENRIHVSFLCLFSLTFSTICWLSTLAFFFSFWMLDDLVWNNKRKRARKLKFRVQQIYCCEFLYCLIVWWCNDYGSSNAASFPLLLALFLHLSAVHVRQSHQSTHQ